MAGVNKVITLGHLGKDPEMRYMADGKAVANFSLATSETFKDKEGNKQERTEWHRIVLWGRLAEIAGEYLRKGSMAYIEGRLQTRKWTDKEGQEKYVTEIIGDRLQLVGSKNGNGESNQSRSSGSSQPENRPTTSSRTTQTGPSSNTSQSDPFDDGFDDDIPF